MQYREIILLLISLLWAGLIYGSEGGDWRRVEESLKNVSVSKKDAGILIKNAKMRNVSSKQVLQWTLRLEDLKKNKLPVQSMIDRIQQGISKGIPAARIDGALNTLAKDLAWGKNLVASHVPVTELEANPDILEKAIINLEIVKRQGFKPNEIEHVLGKNTLNIHQVEMVSGMLTDWNVMGHDRGAILATLTQAVEKNMHQNDLLALDQAVINNENVNLETTLSTYQADKESLNNINDARKNSINEIRTEIDTIKNDIKDNITNDLQEEVQSQIREITESITEEIRENTIDDIRENIETSLEDIRETDREFDEVKEEIEEIEALETESLDSPEGK